MIRVRWIAISFVMGQRCFPHIGMFSVLHRECINLHEGRLRNKMHLHSTLKGCFFVLKDFDQSQKLKTISKKSLQCYMQGGLATASDLAAFRLSMIAPVKKSVNHSRTVASMRETDWEHIRSSSSQRFDSVEWIRFWSRWSLLSLL